MGKYLDMDVDMDIQKYINRDINKDINQDIKNSIRRRVLEARRTATPEEVSGMSGAISDKLLGLKEFEAADIIMMYMDFRNEVKTDRIIAEALARGKKVALPVIDNSEGKRELRIFLVNDPEKDLVKCGYGILEPDTTRAEQVDAGRIGLVLVPGVSFGMNRHRIGYGAGYYDRFLSGLAPEVPKIGLAFEFQLTESIPACEFDVAMDMIITESRIIR